VHEVIPEEKAAVKTVRPLKEQYGDWYLAVKHRQQPKKQTQGSNWDNNRRAVFSLGSCRGIIRRPTGARKSIVKESVKRRLGG
jgi:hypothetical protein